MLFYLKHRYFRFNLEVMTSEHHPPSTIHFDDFTFNSSSVFQLHFEIYLIVICSEWSKSQNANDKWKYSHSCIRFVLLRCWQHSPQYMHLNIDVNLQFIHRFSFDFWHLWNFSSIFTFDLILVYICKQELFSSCLGM